MRRLLTIFSCLIFLIVLPVIAQQDEEEVPSPPKHHVQVKIGGAGGFTQNLLFLNLAPFNNILKRENAAPFDNQPMLLLGGQGYGYIMLIPNLRIGGLGASGSMVSRSLDIATNIRRDVELSVGFGGMTFEYTIPVISRLDVAVGVMLGAGSTTIKMTRDANSNKIWNDVWDQYGNDRFSGLTDEYTRTLSGSFFMYQPSFNIEYAVLRWVGLRVGISYNGMASGDWKQDNKYDLIGVPNNISGKGFMINGGIFLGTFMF